MFGARVEYNNNIDGGISMTVMDDLAGAMLITFMFIVLMAL